MGSFRSLAKIGIRFFFTFFRCRGSLVRRSFSWAPETVSVFGFVCGFGDLVWVSHADFTLDAADPIGGGVRLVKGFRRVLLTYFFRRWTGRLPFISGAGKSGSSPSLPSLGRFNFLLPGELAESSW